MDETFGAALVALNESLHAVTLGIQRFFFHQGTINQGTLYITSDFQVLPLTHSGRSSG